MNVRQALLAAADHIEANPQAYCFNNSAKPDCGSLGCLMGWVGVFAEVKDKNKRDRAAPGYANQVAQKVLGLTSWAHFVSLGSELGAFFNYTQDSKQAAGMLRAYADKYHPAPVQAPPDWNTLATEPLPAAEESAICREIVKSAWGLST